MNPNYGEDVGSESTRSIESEDLQLDEVSDLFDHSSEVHARANPENPRALSTAPSAGVPILNNLGRSLIGDLGVEPGQDGPERGVGEGRVQTGVGASGRRPPPRAARLNLQGDPVRPFTRHDIDSSDGLTTLTGSLPSDRLPLGRGYTTRVEGYGKSQEDPGPAMTQPYSGPNHSQPLPDDPGDVKKTVPLKPSGQLDHPSLPSNQNSEGVGFKWADYPDQELPAELPQPASSLRRDKEQLERQELELQLELEGLLKKADGLSQKRTDLIAREGGEQLAQEREGLLHAVVESGSWLPLVLEGQEHLANMGLGRMDVAMCALLVEWNRGWTFCQQAQTHARLEVRETAQVLEQVSDLLELQLPQLGKVVDQEKLRELADRHQLLSDGLSRHTVSRQVAALFPESQAQEIVDWYGQLRTGLGEMERMRAQSWEAACIVRGLLDRYPGPRLAPAEAFPPMASAPERRGGPCSTDGLESYRSDYRAQAQSAGRGYRMGGGTPGSGGELPQGGYRGIDPMDLPPHLVRSRGGRAGDLHSGLGGELPKGGFRGRDPLDLPPHLAQSRGEPEEEPESRVVTKRGSASVRSGVSSYDEESGVTGFEGAAMEEIMEELAVYVCDALAAIGKDTPVTVGIIMDCLPTLNLWTKNQSSTTKEFARAVKDIKPRTSDSYISVREWWKAINLLADDYGWALRVRVTFMRRTGGLAPKHNDDIAQRVKDFIEHPNDWVRSAKSFEASTPESNQRYWLYLWIDVGLKLISEFHQVQQVDVVEEQLGELMDEERWEISADVDDPLNSQIHKVQSLYKAMNTWLRDRSSALVDSPLYVWKLLVEWLKTNRPVGPLMLTHINRALNQLGSNVEEALPKGHGRTKAQLEAIRRGGVMGATEDTYGLILERLKLKGVNGELTMEVKTFSQMKDLQEQSQGEGDSRGKEVKKKKSVSKVHSVTTDYQPSVSTMTLNTYANSGQRFTPCPTCKLFHQLDKLDSAGKPMCLFYDPVKRTFKTKAYLAHKNVVVMNRRGERSLSDYWTKKLEQYAFPAMGITTTKDKNTILKDLRDAVAAMPKASVTEIKKYAEDSKRFVAMVEQEDMHNIRALRKEVTTLVNMAASLSTTKSGKKREKKERQSARKKELQAKKEADSDSSSEEDDSSSEESDSSSD